MRRFLQNSRWEWTFYTGAVTVLVYASMFVWSDITSSNMFEDWLAWAAVLLLASMIVAYMLGRRVQRRIDMLQLALKQAAAGNWNAKLPLLRMDAFSGVYRDFNAMLRKLESRLQLLQQLGEKSVEQSSSLEHAVLEERRRLARDLHDTVSQQLFAIHMSASSLPKLLEKDPEHAAKLMEQLISMSSAAQRQMRGLIAQLRPLELQGRTLGEALDRWFPDYCRQNMLQGKLDIQLQSRLNEAKEHQLFLIIQEAMANVVKHAEAASVRMYVGETESQIALQIEDDGAGFRADQARSGSYGLSTMRERSQKLGGDAEIVSKPGAGTKVKVWFPKFETDREKENG